MDSNFDKLSIYITIVWNILICQRTAYQTKVVPDGKTNVESKRTFTGW